MNNSMYVFKSATPKMYATIPMWALRTKKPVQTLRCMKYHSKKYIDVDVAELKELVANHKIWVSRNEETGEQYIQSVVWMKHFS